MGTGYHPLCHSGYHPLLHGVSPTLPGGVMAYNTGIAKIFLVAGAANCLTISFGDIL